MLTRFANGHHHVTCAKVASLIQMVLIGFSSVIGVIMPSIMSTQIPRFLPTPTNVTYRRGQLATLRCSVDKLGTKFVVWRKASDPNPLTVGREKFADDPYIGVSHQATNWNLIIKNVQPRHAGVYECQVSSVHQLIRHIMLRVVDNTVKKNGFLTISGSSSVTRGSAISLMCNSSGGDSRSRDINWYKEGTKIYSNRDNRILTTKYTSADKVTVSSLRIENSRLEDGGVYVCRTPNKASITIDVKVHNSSGTTVNGTFVKREEHKAGSEQAYRGDNNRIEPTQTTNGQISNSQFTPQLPCFLLLFYLLIYSTEHL
ncbi:protogenin A-like isoform X4 [Octopus sinensis]|uniref:Protogenin A-like isoform X4 n=1 Tax=Octopus sinensis TaxID=2607531 RepID=A0A7E6F8W6_9MOLL|nr:protogenin A-like isoform X4 [Octopus sinensis]